MELESTGTKSMFVKNYLEGNNAFYKAPTYLTNLRKDFFSEKILPVAYTWNSQTKVWRVAKQVFSIMIFPVGIYQLIHGLIAGATVLPAAKFRKSDFALEERKKIKLDEKWKFKRITIEVDGYKIDAAIMGRENTFSNGKWVLSSLGNNQIYEEKLQCINYKQILEAGNYNALVFNYPGVGASPFMPSRQAMCKAYRAMLKFLEDQKKGIGATHIIGDGYSVGGAIQGDALKVHKFKKNIKYLFIKNRTFSDMSCVVSELKGFASGLLVKILGWNMGSIDSSATLTKPEIILQTANVETYSILHEDEESKKKIIFDEALPPESTLGWALLNEKKGARENRLIIGIPDKHEDLLTNTQEIVNQIEVLLDKQDGSF